MLRLNRSRANAAGQAHFSRQARVQRVFDHSNPAIDPEKNEPVPARERLPLRRSRIVWSILCIGLISNFIGCTTFHSTFGKKIPKATAANPVVEIVCLWQPGEGRDPEGVPCKGFSGQILFLSRSSSTPVQIEGDIRVYLFDDQGTPEEQARPLRQFDFDNGAWGIHLAESSFGPTYSVFIPYVRRGKTNAECSLRVRLKPKTGPTVFSDFTNMPLNGQRKSVTGEEAKAINQQEVDRLAAEAMTNDLRRTTTISMQPEPKTKDNRSLLKTDANANPIQLASHEVVSESTNGVAEADRIRRLEAMVQQLLEQQVALAASPAGATVGRLPSDPSEKDSEPNRLNGAGGLIKASRRMKARREDDPVSEHTAAPRRIHPLDDGPI